MSVAWAGVSTQMCDIYTDMANRSTDSLLAKLRISGKPSKIEPAA